MRGRAQISTCLLLLWVLCACSKPYRIVEAEFQNQEITFSARLLKPEGPGPFPAVVLVHGSKNHTKDYYGEYSEYFAENGIAALSFDTRGHGQTNGNLWHADFHDLATDVASAVEYLKSLDFVDADRIGLWADSHGGWIVLIADTLSSDVHFIISKSGPAVTPLRTVEFDVDGNYLKPKEVPDSERRRILDLYPKIFRYLTRDRSEELWRSIEAELRHFEPTPYFKEDFDKYYLQILGPPQEMPPVEEVELAPSGRDYDFDPVPFLEKLETRTLLIYGTGDRLIPVDECVEIVEAIDNPAISLKVYPKADHGIRVRRGPELLLKPGFPRDYLPGLVDFILSRPE